ncbi:MAG: zinc ribbon domain-containing protein [Bacteroidaceae bacterium]|nr:zinc ribbon domain-containing protein [Bacteroidaceae bacterium]
MKKCLSIALFLLVALLFCACQPPGKSSQMPRPYGPGYNFHVHADSLLLQEDRPMHWCQGVAETSDSLWVFHDNQIVVAAITVIPEDCVDSVWVKVARDQFTMGWTHENDLLAAACPDDPISHIIYFLSTIPVPLLLTLLAILLLVPLVLLVRRRPASPLLLRSDIPSFTPTMLLTTLGMSLLLYAFILRCTPQAWCDFYYLPTLNPFSQPPLLCLFLASLWICIMLFIICIDDIFKLLRPAEACIYLLSLLSVCVIIILLAQWLPTFLFALFWLCLSVFAVLRYWHHGRPRFFCGQCGNPLRQKGPCPRCGAIND